jgi:hypothetical protein
MKVSRSGPMVALLLGAACAPVRAPPAPTPAAPPQPALSEWEQLASDDDLARLKDIDRAWRSALGEARGRGFLGAIAEEGELLQPDAALPRAAPPPGSYHCRIVKLGAQRSRRPTYAPYKPFFCYVEAEGELLTIVKQTGSQRPAGRLYPDSDRRLIFLGTLALGDEEAPLPYGENPQRDMAGVVERVAPFRWRLVIPWPRTESKLDVMELVPATP